MTWQLRRATAADLDAVMALENAIFGTDAWSAAAMRSELASAHTYYLVAVALDRNSIDGYAGLLAPQGGAQADVQTIAVADRARRQGLGRTLMQALVAEARRRGADEVFLEVRADNPGAEALYTGLGFDRIGVRPAYYQPDGVDAHVLRLVIPAPETRPAVSS
jgi:ribosomal-protein-alanine N-acetyltransferase